MSEFLQDHHHLLLRLEEAEVRERCAVLLKVAQGASPHQVARHGLLLARDPDSVYSWLRLSQREGLVGLLAHRQGGNQRGRL